MSTTELYMDEEEIQEFITETFSHNRDYRMYSYGEEGAEYGVCPFITFYIYTHNHCAIGENPEVGVSHDDDFLPLSHEVIELYQELQTLTDVPFLRCYNSKTQNWVKTTPEKMGREFLQEHAKLAAIDGYKEFWMKATSDESSGASACWAISAEVTDNPWMRFTTVKISFRDKWFRAGNNRQVWRAFVQKWIERLQPEQCYSGYEIGTTTTGVGGAYESDVMERICADYFYGLDVDHPGKMGFHNHDDKDGYIDYTALGSGLRAPTWSFMLSPLWRNKLGKSIEEVKAALHHPDIRITEIPYAANPHNPNGEPALWIQLGELSLYPVSEGVPELPMIANKLIRPIRCNLLKLYTLDPWEDDPNPRFDFENSPKWMARFDEDSSWPNKQGKRKIALVGTVHERVEGGEPCPQDGHWWTPAGDPGRGYFKKGDVMPNYPSSQYGATIWYREKE